MNLIDFVSQFEMELEEIEAGTLAPETEFRKLEEWDSMTALTIIAMVDREYNKQIDGNELREAKTIEDLFKAVKNK